jgi:5-formyltetrahydrofolate cyclo-ligase
MKEKEILRKKILEARRAQPASESLEKSTIIQRRFLSLPEYKKAETILVYISMKDEAATDEIISRSLREGKRIAVPSLLKDRKSITPSLLTNPEKELIEGVFGIREPAEEFIRPVPPSEIDLAAVPGAVFDSTGGRIGFGGGYYDRLIPGLKPGARVIALAFSFQVVERVPVSPHDVNVDFVVTENGVIDCG